MKPKISVVMSVFNQERFVRKAIKSILRQTYKNFELIIVDDGSTDKSVKIISSFSDPRIKLIHNKNNIGLTKSLNQALKVAKGEFIARMDGDDVSYPRRFELQLAAFANDKDLFLIGSQADLIDNAGRKIKTTKMPIDSKSLKKVAIRFNPFIHPTIFFKKKLLNQIGYYNQNFHYAQDYDFILKVMAKFSCRNLAQPLLGLRVSNQSISIAKHKQQQLMAVRIRLHALLNYHYPWYYFVFLAKPFVSALIPINWKKYFYPI